ncbi:hypothetical protein ABZ504_51040, partial [Streptomyces mirabilis]
MGTPARRTADPRDLSAGTDAARVPRRVAPWPYAQGAARRLVGDIAQNDEALTRGIDGIKASYDKFVSKGRLEAHDADA